MLGTHMGALWYLFVSQPSASIVKDGSDLRDLSWRLRCSSLVKVRSHMLHCFSAIAKLFLGSVSDSMIEWHEWRVVTRFAT